MADRSTQDPPQDVATALVGRDDPVGGEEGDGAAVVRDDLVAEPLLLEGVRSAPRPSMRVTLAGSMRAGVLPPW